jgi:hypothetical protein
MPGGRAGGPSTDRPRPSTAHRSPVRTRDDRFRRSWGVGLCRYGPDGLSRIRASRARNPANDSGGHVRLRARGSPCGRDRLGAPGRPRPVVESGPLVGVGAPHPDAGGGHAPPQLLPHPLDRSPGVADRGPFTGPTVVREWARDGAGRVAVRAASAAGLLSTKTGVIESPRGKTGVRLSCPRVWREHDQLSDMARFWPIGLRTQIGTEHEESLGLAT